MGQEVKTAWDRSRRNKKTLDHTLPGHSLPLSDFQTYAIPTIELAVSEKPSHQAYGRRTPPSPSQPVAEGP